MSEKNTVVAERTSDYGMIPGLAEAYPREKSLEMFRRITYIRNFELRLAKAMNDKDVQIFVYLGLGQESIHAAISMDMQGAILVPQHRAQGSYLTFGGDPAKLVDEYLGLPTGCCKGMGGAPSVHDFDKKMIGHNHLIGDNVPIAVGVSYAAPKEKVVCIFGDGAAEEDYVLGALGFAATHKLPILFIVDDNDLSVLTPIRDRRSWKISDVAKGYGMQAVDITDDPWLIQHHVKNFSTQLPALINIRTCRELWHQGTGNDGPPEWNRYEITKQKMLKLGFTAQELEQIDLETKNQVGALWNERLQKRSETLPGNT